MGNRENNIRPGFTVMTPKGERWFTATMSTQPDGSIYGYLSDGGRLVYGTVRGDGRLCSDRFEPDGLYPPVVTGCRPLTGRLLREG